MLDFNLNRYIWRAQHLFALFCISLVYLAFNYAWTVISGTPVYAPITWKDPVENAILILGFLLADTIIFFIYYFICLANSQRTYTNDGRTITLLKVSNKSNFEFNQRLEARIYDP